jgi:hypothetical protein
MAKHKATDRKSSGRRGASSSAGQQQKHSKKHSKRADLAGKVVKHRRPWDCRDQLETAFLTKIAKLPTELGFFMTMPAANNGPVRIHSHNLTTRQSIAMVKALNRTLPFPQSRLEKWTEQAVAEAKAKAKGGGKQRKVQQQR